MKANNFFYPPGGILIWIIVLVELTTFGIALGALHYFEHFEEIIFSNGRSQLNTVLGSINTMVLLTSGFLIADSVKCFAQKDKSLKKLRWASLLGVVFVVIKLAEYYQKFTNGIGITTNTFYSFYFMLTGFHLVHVLFGLSLLFYFIIKHKKHQLAFDDLEAGAIFWHLCDLIWLLIFPFLYLKS